MTAILPARKLILALCALCVSLRGEGDPAFGILRGIVRNADHQPLIDAQLTIHNEAEDGDRTVLSGPDGTFVLDGLTPGRYKLSGSKPGLANSRHH